MILGTLAFVSNFPRVEFHLGRQLFVENHSSVPKNFRHNIAPRALHEHFPLSEC